MMRKIWSFLVMISIFYISCVSLTPWEKYEKRYHNDFIIAENNFLNEYKNKELIIWEKVKRFIDIDITDTYRLDSVKITIDPEFEPGLYREYGDFFQYNINVQLINNRTNEPREIVFLWGYSTSNVNHYSFPESFMRKAIRERYFIEKQNNSDVPNRNDNETFIFINNQYVQNAYERQRNSGTNQSQTRQTRQDNVNKLVALLLNPMASGQFGQFTRGEVVNISRAFLRVIDLQQSGNSYSYLVMVNDNNISKPFYVNTNRMLNLMDIGYPNTVFEELVIQYVGTENYLFNGVPRETFVFQLSR